MSIALIGGLSPLGVLPAALFFGFLETGALAMQRAVGVPTPLVSVIQGLTMVFVLSAMALGHRPPAGVTGMETALLELLAAAVRIATPLLFAALGGILSSVPACSPSGSRA